MSPKLSLLTSVTTSHVTCHKINKLENVAINGVLPLKAARRDAVAKSKYFGSFESGLQTNPMPFHFDSPWSATLMPIRECAMDRRRQVCRAAQALLMDEYGTN